MKKGTIKFPVNIQESYENLAMQLFCPESIKLSDYLIRFSFPSVSFYTKLGFMNGQNPTAMPFSQGHKTDTAKKKYLRITGVFVQATACEWREKVHNIFSITSTI